MQNRFGLLVSDVMPIYMIIALDIVMIICFSINCPTVICSPTICYFQERASSENYGPRFYLNYILKILKIPYCTFTLFILFCIFVRSIYLSPYNLIMQLTANGLTTPCSRWVRGFIVLCAGAANELLRDSPTRLITLVS